MAERDQNGKRRAIEKWCPGCRIPTLLQAERADAAPPRLEIDPALWREVFLVQDDKDNGGVLTMALLRPLEWLEQHGVELGAWVAIDLPEMGVEGKALVTAVQPCPEIEEGDGRLVTGTFRRSKALVLELKVSGEPEVLGVTGNHLVWSQDRQDWVAVKDLRIGERMRAWDGSTPEVESLTGCSEPEPVYNLEVEGDHCYRVGEQGLLVHNQSVGQTTSATPSAQDTCDCRLSNYRAAHPGVGGLAQYVFRQERNRPNAHHTVRTGNAESLWSLACAIHEASGVTSVRKATVAVGLACFGGAEFRVIVAYNVTSSAQQVRQAASQEGAGFAAPTGDGRHSEQVLIDYVRDGGGSLVAIAASRCICPDLCAPAIDGANAEAVSPIGGPTAYYTCRAGAISRAAGGRCGRS